MSTSSPVESADQPPTWHSAREAARVICHRRHLWRTCVTALVVGTILFAINHMDTVLTGRATTETWIKIGLTYLVPFVVANTGLLMGCHRPSG